VIDSHCHLAGPEFAADLEDVVRRARDAGVSRAFVILAADDGKEVEQAAAVRRLWPDVRFSIGVHPHAAGAFADDPAAAARIVEQKLDEQPGARAVGEIGLDYHYDFAPRAVQQAVFRTQIDLAQRRGFPVVIHTREADEDTFRILQEAAAAGIGGVFHCFTGDRAMASRVLDLGFHISLSGIVTFPKAAELHEVAKLVPADRLLVETDSPFLAPVPYRGKRNEPAHVVHVAEAVARLRSQSLGEIDARTSANFDVLFAP
jgi:TatD DNase family protein